MLSFVAGVVSSFGRRRLIGDDKLLETINDPEPKPNRPTLIACQVSQRAVRPTLGHLS